MILSGDIGGTKTILALLESSSEKQSHFIHFARFPSQRYGSLPEIISEFLNECKEKKLLQPLSGACFAIAGPIKKDKIQLPNLPWEVDPIQLAEVCQLPKVHLINDLESNAYGIQTLEQNDFHLLKSGNEEHAGNQAIIAPGTGLGEAGLFWNGKMHIPIATEGGHADFAPKNELEIELLRYLRSRFEHVSYERLLSGPGLVNIYDFLRDQKKIEEPAWLIEQMKSVENMPATISENGLKQTTQICTEALNIFVSILGSEAGNLALKFLSKGGLFLGGGISPKILPKLKEHFFLDAFYDKGRMRAILEPMSIRVILENKTALKGAAFFCLNQKNS